MMWLSLALCMEMVVTTLALITLGLSAPYAVQLWRAPPYEGTTATGSFSALMATYLAPPLVTVALALANMSLFALASRGHLKQLPRRYPIVMAATMAVGWIAVAVIWGHCHADAGNNPDNPWDTVCYHLNIQDDGGDFILGVNEDLGNAMVAAAAFLPISYMVYLGIQVFSK